MQLLCTKCAKWEDGNKIPEGFVVTMDFTCWRCHTQGTSHDLTRKPVLCSDCAYISASCRVCGIGAENDTPAGFTTSDKKGKTKKVVITQNKRGAVVVEEQQEEDPLEAYINNGVIDYGQFVAKMERMGHVKRGR